MATIRASQAQCFTTDRRCRGTPRPRTYHAPIRSAHRPKGKAAPRAGIMAQFQRVVFAGRGHNVLAVRVSYTVRFDWNFYTGLTVSMISLRVIACRKGIDLRSVVRFADGNR